MKNDEENIENQLQKFGEAVRTAAKMNHKMTARQVEFFTNAIREQGQEQPQSESGPQSDERTISNDKAATKSARQSNQQSEEHGHSH